MNYAPALRKNSSKILRAYQGYDAKKSHFLGVNI